MSQAGDPKSGSARSGRKERAVLALLEHPTIEKAAACGRYLRCDTLAVATDGRNSRTHTEKRVGRHSRNA